MGLFKGSGDPNLPGYKPSGLAGFVNRLYAPDPNTTAGKIGLLAQAIGAQGGSDFSQGTQALQDQQHARLLEAQQNEFQRLRTAIEARKLTQPQTQTVGHTLGVIDPTTGGFTPTYTAPEEEPPAVRIARAAGLAPGTPEWQKALTAAVPGYANTEPVVAMKAAQAQALAAQRAAASASLKAMPTYAATHPKAGGGAGGGVTANKRADVIAQAQRAIAAGADPAKVKARAAQMGVRF